MPLLISEASKPKLTPSALSLRKFLDAAPVDQVFTTVEVQKATGVSSSSIINIAREFDFSKYRFKIGRQVYWGSPRAIAALRNRA